MSIPARGLYIAAAIVTALAMAGCAPVPLAENYPISDQKKMRAVHHWEALAQYAGKKIPKDMTGKDMTGKDIKVHPGTYVIEEGTVRSPFGRAFESYLSDELAKSCQNEHRCVVTQGHKMPGGLNIDPSGNGDSKCQRKEADSNSYTDPVYIQYGVQRVHHRASDGHPPFGLFTLLGTGVWLGHQAYTHWTVADEFPAAIGEGAAIDLLSSVIAAPTHTEVIISYVVSDGNGNTVVRGHQNFYVADADADEYPDLPLYVAAGPSQTVCSTHVSLTR